MTIGRDGEAFRASIDVSRAEPAVNDRAWVTANDRIYWGNGICDRTFYDAGLAAAAMTVVPPEDATIDDQTSWATFVEPVPVGETTLVGDMSVTVEAAEESNGVLDVTVTIGGVQDPDGASGFRLIASGRPVTAGSVGDPASSCAGTTLAPTRCQVVFDVSTADGTSRVLFYERGDQQARWVLG